jgi:hypothetical protein
MHHVRGNESGPDIIHIESEWMDLVQATNKDISFD